MLPRAFGRYTLFDHIGKGGMADIYLARAGTDLGGSRLAVVKQILVEYADVAQFADMLIYEAKLAASLNHANVVQVFDLGRADGHLFIAMEYVEGFDLNNLLRRCSKQRVPLPMEFALYIVVSALRGLDYAHRRVDDFGKPLGIVHRDVSPSNVLISFEGEVKVCDFGIAHANDLVKFGGSIVDEAIKGKAGYMSPEHAAGEIIDSRADVFAAGIVLWELLAGRRMYRQDQTRTSLLEQARRADIPPLPVRGVPGERDLHGVVGKALARDKTQRYPSAAAMLRELETYAVGSGRLASPLKIGEWLVSHFGEDVIKQRKIRERAAAAIARGPLVVMTPIAPMIAAQLAEEMNRAMPGSIPRDSDRGSSLPPALPSSPRVSVPPALPSSSPRVSTSAPAPLSSPRAPRSTPPFTSASLGTPGPPVTSSSLLSSSSSPPPPVTATAISAPPLAFERDEAPSVGGKTVAYGNEGEAVAAALAAAPPSYASLPPSNLAQAGVDRARLPSVLSGDVPEDEAPTTVVERSAIGELEDATGRLPRLPGALEEATSESTSNRPAALAPPPAPPSIATNFDVSPPSLSSMDVAMRVSAPPVPRRRRKSSVLAVLLLLVACAIGAAWYLRLLG